MRIKTNKPKNTYTSLGSLYPDPGKKKKIVLCQTDTYE